MLGNMWKRILFMSTKDARSDHFIPHALSWPMHELVDPDITVVEGFPTTCVSETWNDGWNSHCEVVNGVGESCSTKGSASLASNRKVGTSELQFPRTALIRTWMVLEIVSLTTKTGSRESILLRALIPTIWWRCKAVHAALVNTVKHTSVGNKHEEKRGGLARVPDS